MFMTNNADRIMEVNRQHSQLKNGVNNCKQPYETGTMLPELNKVKCDLNKCRSEFTTMMVESVLAEFTTLTKLLLQTALMVLDSPLVTFQSSVWFNERLINILSP